MLFKKNIEITEEERIKASIYGFIVGDALGVPVEFVSRKDLSNKKVTDMEEYGTHKQPKGTWSDDSSMVIATIDSINTNRKIDYFSIMANYLEWFKNGKYTPFNFVFDIGNTTSFAIYDYQINQETYLCGSKDIYSNGNGSLMRILPISLYVYYNNNLNNYEIIKNISSMTHAHDISIISCYIYSEFIKEILTTKDKIQAYKNMQKNIKEFLINNEYSNKFDRLIENDISKYTENEIKSTGYVIDSLEACIWCFLTTNNYKDAVIKAVNLGDDTDTIGALTGALAGLLYGIKDIPNEWLNSLQRKEYLDEIINSYSHLLGKITNGEV